MLDIVLEKTGPISGELRVPGDKSISHRALIFGAIADGVSEATGLLMGADNLATLQAMRQLGVQIDELGDGHVVIHGVGLHGLRAPQSVLDLGNSGTGIRILTGLLAGQAFDCELTGDASLRRRPMRRIVAPLTQMGACIEMSCDETPPLQIKGNMHLKGIEYAMPVASAQVKSCLLLAGLYADGEVSVIEPAPARDHTERLLQACAYPITIHKNKVSLTGGHHLQAFNMDIPGDISSAAFFMVAATIVPNSNITLKNVGINPTRIGIITILKLMGANIELTNQRVAGNEPVADITVRSAQLKGIDIPSSQVPLAIDEFPVIFIAAACATGTTRLCDAKELRVKESDRIAAMAEGLQTLGIEATPTEDGIIIQGGRCQGGQVDSYDDHRIAMAFAIAACVADSPVTIKNCTNIQTSYPAFLPHLKQLTS